MDGLEKRKARRIPCRVPARIGNRGAWIAATAIDLSRTGALVSFPLRALGLEGAPTLLTLARRLCSVLPQQTLAQFDPDRLGSLVSRDIDVARMGLSTAREPQVELGCRFRVPLTEVDSAALDVRVPTPAQAPGAWTGRRAVRPVVAAEDLELAAKGSPPPLRPETRRKPAEAADNASERTPADSPARLRRSGQRFRAYLIPQDGSDAPPAVAWTEHLDTKGAVLLLPQWHSLPLPEGIEDVNHLVVALCEAYGSRVTLKITDTVRHLWTGPAEIRGAEMLRSASDALLVDLRFGRNLRPAELQALDLV